MSRFFLYLVMVLIFAGCEFDIFQEDSTAEAKQQKKNSYEAVIDESRSFELNEKALQAKHKKEMAEVAIKKDLAAIDLKKQVELGKLDHSARIKELELHKEQEIEKLKLQARMDEEKRNYAAQRDMILLAVVLVLVMAYGLFILFKRRHDNKLRAYNDNLQKYFHHKENETRMRLAEKIIDTIAEGKTQSGQEKKLIEILHGVSSEDGDERIDNSNISSRDEPPKIES